MNSGQYYYGHKLAKDKLLIAMYCHKWQQVKCVMQCLLFFLLAAVVVVRPLVKLTQLTKELVQAMSCALAIWPSGAAVGCSHESSIGSAGLGLHHGRSCLCTTWATRVHAVEEW